MNTTDSEALIERLYRAWCPPEWDEPPKNTTEATVRAMHREMTESWITAILPIVAEEVRKAEAEVWVKAIRYSIECGNETTDSWGNMYRLDWIDRMEREIEQNPYAPEIGDSNEHR